MVTTSQPNRGHSVSSPVPLRVLRVLRWVGTTLVLVLVFAALMLGIFIRTSSAGTSTIFNHPVFSVLSGSMTPTFDTGDVIIDNPITAAQAESLHVGQIITFNSNSIVITHRIVGVTGSGSAVTYQTKGDANNAPDQTPVSPTAIVGVYSGRVPFAGYVLSTLHQPLTFVILVMIPVVYLVVVEIRRRWVLYGEQDRLKAEAHWRQDATGPTQPDREAALSLHSSGRRDR